MLKFVQDAINIQNGAYSKADAIRKFQTSCEICCLRGMHIKCENCKVKDVHTQTIAAFDDQQNELNASNIDKVIQLIKNSSNIIIKHDVNEYKLTNKEKEALTNAIEGR